MAEDEQLENFFNQHDKPEINEELIKFFKNRSTISEDSFNEEEWKKFSASEKIDPKLSKKIWSRIAGLSLKKKTELRFLYLKVGAVAALLCAAIGVFFLIKNHKPNTKEIASANNEAAEIIVKNPDKDTLFITLKDSTAVKLLKGSSIAYSKTFASDNRNVKLSGEAYFTAAHEKIPFTVLTDKLTITDKGTVFSVKNYEEDSAVKIRLYEGKVSVSTSEKTYPLHPGELLTYNKSNGICTLSENAKKQNQTAVFNNNSGANDNSLQSNNWYMFNNQLLSDVFNQLAYMYNTRIEYDSSDIAGITFIGRLDKHDSIKKLLTDIAALNNLSVEKIADGYRIYRKK